MAFDKSYGGRSAQLRQDSVTRLPAEAKIRCLRDQIVVEPLDVIYSETLIVFSHTKPLRGIVKVVGPGTYPRKYASQSTDAFVSALRRARPGIPDEDIREQLGRMTEKSLRTKTWDSNTFRPCEVKIGNVVELGGSEIGGYAFQTFYWGDKLHLWAREEDVAVVDESFKPDCLAEWSWPKQREAA